MRKTRITLMCIVFFLFVVPASTMLTSQMFGLPLDDDQVGAAFLLLVIGSLGEVVLYNAKY